MPSSRTSRSSGNRVSRAFCRHQVPSSTSRRGTSSSRSPSSDIQPARSTRSILPQRAGQQGLDAEVRDAFSAIPVSRSASSASVAACSR